MIKFIYKIRMICYYTIDTIILKLSSLEIQYTFIILLSSDIYFTSSFKKISVGSFLYRISYVLFLELYF
jgi:hypothetical protein